MASLLLGKQLSIGRVPHCGQKRRPRHQPTGFPSRPGCSGPKASKLKLRMASLSRFLLDHYTFRTLWNAAPWQVLRSLRFLAPTPVRIHCLQRRHSCRTNRL